MKYNLLLTHVYPYKQIIKIKSIGSFKLISIVIAKNLMQIDISSNNT